MCGIAGIVDFADRPVSREPLERACEILSHRGPDDAGTCSVSSAPLHVGLAATRLAIIDPTPAGRQPMCTPDGRFNIVFNGLIYNYRELAAELTAAGETLRSKCDTEVALAACARWGPDALNRFNGMWALAFYDRQENRGFLARDRFGIKPLVWCLHEGRLAFASEMRALAMLGDWPRDIDPAALAHYIRFGYVLHPDTIYRCVRRLEPGTYLPFDPSGVQAPVRYYSLPRPQETESPIDRVATARRIRRAIFHAVARRRVADVPIGAFLSGGLDSSIIVAHLAEVSPEPVKTFAVGWAEHGAYDETQHARQVARRFGTEHYELKCKFADVFSVLPRILDHLGEPFFDSSILPTAIVSQFARRHVTVSLSGDGGDELFGGYWRYLAHGLYDRYASLPRWLRSGLIEPLLRSRGQSKSSAISNRVRQFRKMLRAGDGDELARHVAWSRILAPEAADVLRTQPPDDPAVQRLREETADFDAGDPLNRILAFDLLCGLPCDMLHKVDLASMYHSLEVRVPFLDPEVVATAMSLPSSMKVDRGCGKVILREAYRDLLPEEVLSRTKMGFEVPIGEFLRHELREMFRDTVTRPVIESFGLLDYDAVERVYADHCARRSEHADLLFALLSLCWWRRNENAGLSSERRVLSEPRP